MAPVWCMAQVSDTQLLALMIAPDSDTVDKCFEEVVNNPAWQMCKTLVTSNKCAMKGLNDAMKAKMASQEGFSLIDSAPGKVTAGSKGTTLYYLRIMEIKTKAGKMAEFVDCAAKLLAMTSEEEHTSQFIPMGEDCVYFVEINKPEHWEAVSQKYKEASSFLSLAAASSECVESVKYFCAGAKPSQTCPLAPAPDCFLTGDAFMGWI